MRIVEVVNDDGLRLKATVSGAGESVLIALHGGPGGGGGDYLSALHGLGGDHRRVVVFDQLGTGGSDVPPAGYRWSMESAVADVEAVRRFLDVETVDVFGHSYGGLLALDHALTHPDAVRRLILSNTAASVARIEAEFRLQVTALADADVAARVLAADAAVRHDDPEFIAIVRAWLLTFSTHGDDAAADDQLAEALDLGPAGAGLWGRSVWTADGALKGWDVEPRLHEVRAPTLVVNGGTDMSSASTNAVLAQRIPDCEWLTFNGSGHDPLEEPTRTAYLGVLHAFLSDWPTPSGA